MFSKKIKERADKKEREEKTYFEDPLYCPKQKNRNIPVMVCSPVEKVAFIQKEK